MNASDINFFGARLKLARKMAGMSLQDLSDVVKNVVTKQSLNKYEQGLMNPSNEVIMDLSKVLNVKPDFFLNRNILELGVISFRKHTSLTKKEEDSIIERVRYYIERVVEIENILGLDQHFENPINDLVINNKADVENAANKLRVAWELGNAPIPNIIEMLELKGVKILLVNNGDHFDGLAIKTEMGCPVVAINSMNKSTERIRFTIIHELAHILLKFSDQISGDDGLIEKLCHFFSSCFLLPSKMLLQMIGGNHRTYINIKELIAIKEYFGISIRATVHRLCELNVISQNYYQRWMIFMSKTYGQKSEPGDYKGQEEPKLFEQLINRALSEGIISLSKGAALMNSDVYKIRKGFIDVE